MLSCKSSKTGGLELTDKKTTVALAGASVSLAEETFESPGEYESNGVEVIYGQTAALIVWERLQIVYVFGSDAPSNFEAGQFSSCDVLVIGGRESSLDKAAITPLFEAYDPTVVVISPVVKVDDSLKETLKIQETDQVKLAAATLPVEGRDTFQLQ